MGVAEQTSSDDPREYAPLLERDDMKYSSNGDSGHGAIAPKTPRKKTRPMSHMVVAVALPWLLFTLVLFLFLCAYRELAPVVWTVLILLIALSILFVALGVAARDPVYLALGFLSLAGAATGAAVGLFLDTEYMEQFWRLENGVEYQRVNPMENSEATADASAIAFVNETFVDDRRTLGFQADGKLYCVAPVALPPLYSKRVEYWAVGVDCCEKRMNFECGASRGFDALTAVVQKRTPHYMSAVETALSVYGLVAVEQAELVQFVDDVGAVKRDARDSAILIALSAVSLHLCASALAGLLIIKAQTWHK